MDYLRKLLNKINRKYRLNCFKRMIVKLNEEYEKSKCEMIYKYGIFIVIK